MARSSARVQTIPARRICSSCRSTSVDRSFQTVTIQRSEVMSAGKCRMLFAVAACAFSAAAVADVPLPLDRVALSLGGFYPTVDARVSANGPAVAGTDVNFQRD